jgi:hypothetical protein
LSCAVGGGLAGEVLLPASLPSKEIDDEADELWGAGAAGVSTPSLRLDALTGLTPSTAARGASLSVLLAGESDSSLLTVPGVIGDDNTLESTACILCTESGTISPLTSASLSA